MKAVFVTIFPELIESFFSVGVINKAVNESTINFEVVNPIKFLKDNERLDDAPYGGGPGMLIRSEPLEQAIKESKKLTSSNAKVINLSPQGKKLTQEKAKELSSNKELIFICGRYEGIDQRIIDSMIDEEISIGDYILSGGESASFVIIDSILRLLPGVLGNEKSKDDESFENGLLEYPQYTKPQIWEKKSVPEVLLSGDHAKIKDWRLSQSKDITRRQRPDLWEKYLNNKKNEKY